jgi:hypothetical protein
VKGRGDRVNDELSGVRTEVVVACFDEIGEMQRKTTVSPGATFELRVHCNVIFSSPCTLLGISFSFINRKT